MAAESQIDSFVTQRLRMVESQLRARGIRDERVLTAMSQVPRHEFVSADYGEQVYEDHPIPIGEDQTLSQPYIVAIMLEALALSSSDRVLEVGAGSGYQTALLAELTQQVYSVERHASLPALLKLRLHVSATPTRSYCSATAARAFPREHLTMPSSSPRLRHRSRHRCWNNCLREAAWPSR